MTVASVRLRLALAQLNTTVGEIAGNTELAAAWIRRARDDHGAQLIVLPELAIAGYPPEDLLLKRHFIEACERALEELAASCEGIVALIGCPIRGPELHNGLAVLGDGRLLGAYRKVRLPNYGVFDERRYFEPGPGPGLIEVAGVRVGLTVCEDIWFPGPPASLEAAAGAALLVNASASPYHRGKGLEREAIVAERARENGVAIALCNAVGGQDELVFDGHSVVVDGGGTTIARATQFEQELLVVELELPPSAAAEAPAELIASIRVSPPGVPPPASNLAEPLGDVEEVYRALCLGLGDYVRKNGFEHVVLGVSGGIDSALVALLAVDALGTDRVTCVVMPSPHSSAETQADARTIVANLGCEAIELPIEPVMEAYTKALDARFAGTDHGIAEENLQARIRGNLVMALSNKFGWMALTTGNKSEMSVGYATLYGDMAGGFAVLKDVPKMLVYELVRFRNGAADEPPIPAAVIERPPSAELRPDQRDSDSLPAYEILDHALEKYVEGDVGHDGLVEAGVDPKVAELVIAMVDRAEYKRRQAPPGVKITPKAFGRDRRLPITNRFGG